MNPAAERNLDRLTLLLLAAMVVVPFQHSHHFNPIPSFFAEWWAALLGLAACATVFLRPEAWQRFPIPAVLLAPLLMLGALLFQYFSGRMAFVEQGLMFASYLLWAMLLACLGQDLRQRRGIDYLADGLAVAFLGGALLEAIVVVLEIRNAGLAGGWVFPRRYAPWGNVGQPNHLNDYLWLATASACFLWSRRHIGTTALVAAAGALIVASALTGSRSIVLYALALAGLGLVASRRGDRDMRRLRLATAALPVAAMAAIVVAHWLGPVLYADPGAGTLERFYADAASPSIRFKIWHSAWHAFVESPWVGHGIGSLPWQNYLASTIFVPGQQPPVAEHAHNLPLQMLVEFGAPLTLAAMAVVALWIRRYLQRPWTPARWWLAALLLVTGLHAMLEYPLWYTFFLGPVALLLGAGDEGRQRLANGRRGLTAFVVVLALSGVILGTLRHDFARMERLLNWQVFGEGKELEWPTAVDTLLDLYRNSLLSPQANLVFAIMMQASTDNLDDRRYICGIARRFSPVTQVVFKCALLEAMAGNDAEAERQLASALAAYPDKAALAAGAFASETARLPFAEALRQQAAAAAARLSGERPVAAP